MYQSGLIITVQIICGAVIEPLFYFGPYNLTLVPVPALIQWIIGYMKAYVGIYKKHELSFIRHLIGYHHH